MILTRDVVPGGAKGTRTPDPLLAKQVLFQLSYSPECGAPRVPGARPGTRSPAAALLPGPCAALSTGPSGHVIRRRRWLGPPSGPGLPRLGRPGGRRISPGPGQERGELGDPGDEVGCPGFPQPVPGVTAGEDPGDDARAGPLAAADAAGRATGVS